MQGKFTQKAKEVIEAAKDISVDFGHGYVGTEHMLMALFVIKESMASKVLEEQGITEEDIEEKIEDYVGTSDIADAIPQDFTPRTKRMLEQSKQEAMALGTDYIGTEHLLIALLRDKDSLAVKVLTALKVNQQRIYDEIMALLGKPTNEQFKSGGGFGGAGGGG